MYPCKNLKRTSQIQSANGVRFSICHQQILSSNLFIKHFKHCCWANVFASPFLNLQMLHQVFSNESEIILIQGRKNGRKTLIIKQKNNLFHVFSEVASQREVDGLVQFEVWRHMLPLYAQAQILDIIVLAMLFYIALMFDFCLSCCFHLILCHPTTDIILYFFMFFPLHVYFNRVNRAVLECTLLCVLRSRFYDFKLSKMSVKWFIVTETRIISIGRLLIDMWLPQKIIEIECSQPQMIHIVRNSQWELQIRLRMIPIESTSSSSKYSITDKTNDGYGFGECTSNTHSVVWHTFINHLFSQAD